MDTEIDGNIGICTVAPGTVSPSFGLHWFPMRVTYSRELFVKAFLDEIGVETFIPMRYEPEEGKHPRHQVLRPAVRNLIFLHSTQERITELKITRREMSAVRYIMRPLYDDKHNLTGREILTVPDAQMENFVRVASVTDDRVFFIENLDFAGKPGQRVKIVEGDFAGVEGVVKRVKKNKCVVVQIEHVAAVAIAFVPTAFLVALEN
ncbi:MAG: UpxY family transcription antiterminator [Prevotella sp.]|nr:UpxY family transcription antiterminator [Prevotella sp.]